MTTMNQAAWLDGPGKPLRVGPADMPTPAAGEIVVRNRAIAVNPVSWKIQDTGKLVQKWPAILDMDIAGEVHEVGPDITRFQKGDRVIAFVEAIISQDRRCGAYQLYTVAKAPLVAKLPDQCTFAEACVLPLAFNTALVSLCAPLGKGFGLPLPSLQPIPSGKTIVVWAASSSMGLLTLQLARAAGIKTIAVASARNHELCTSCGANEVFDYNTAFIEEDVVKAVKTLGGDFVGVLDCVASPVQSVQHCISVLEHFGGGELGLLVPDVHPEVSDKIRVTNVFAGNEMTLPLWRDYVTPALEQGKLKCAPEALVVGEGLGSLQKGLDVQRQGVSAKKVVVTL